MVYRTSDHNTNITLEKSRCQKSFLSSLLSREHLDVHHPSLIHYSSTPLFRLERSSETYRHLVKKKDIEHLAPIVNYFIHRSGHVVYLGGDAVKNLFLHGKRKYRHLNVLAILEHADADKFAAVFNNIISSNDGAFSMGMKYTIRKNRKDGCFKEIACARYIIEPRLEGPEKLLYPLRCSTIELDISTTNRFALTFGIGV